MEDEYRYSKASQLFSELANGAKSQALRFEALSRLFSVANQPLPEPQRAPLVGNDDPRDALSSNEKDILDFVAGLGTVQAQTVEMNIALPSQEVWHVLTLLTQRGLIESFSDTSEIIWYRLPVESVPASGTRPIDAPWMPDEPTTMALDSIPDAGVIVRGGMAFRAPPQSELRPVDKPPTTEPVEGPNSGKRTKTEFAAREWRNSKHFLQYMKQPEFSSWNAETQRVKGDEFVEAIERLSPELKMNRWGDRFKKFHGLK